MLKVFNKIIRILTGCIGYNTGGHAQLLWKVDQQNSSTIFRGINYRNGSVLPHLLPDIPYTIDGGEAKAINLIDGAELYQSI
jgi:hypothetical protein